MVIIVVDRCSKWKCRLPRRNTNHLRQHSLFSLLQTSKLVCINSSNITITIIMVMEIIIIMAVTIMVGMAVMAVIMVNVNSSNSNKREWVADYLR